MNKMGKHNDLVNTEGDLVRVCKVYTQGMS